jgi:hypothetical protein
MKIRPVGAELFHADRHTDIKLIVAFRDFANAPKKGTPYVTTTYVPLSVSLDTVSTTNPSVRFGEKKSWDDDMHDPYTVRLQNTGIWKVRVVAC